MRDVNRIKPFCDELAEIWSKHPDLRFGQIMHNIARYAQWEYNKDIFYIEEKEFMKIIKEHLR